MEFGKKRKRIKLILWFFFALMIDLTIMHNFRIMSARPVLSYVLMIAAMLLEKDFSYAMAVSTITAIIFASLFGGSFGFEVIFLIVAAVIIFSAGKRNRYIPAIAMMCIASAAFTAAHIAFVQIYTDGISSLKSMGNMIIANVIYNVIAGMLIFVPVKKNIYKEDAQRKLIS